ncbi:lytic transglycosylase domain-containing protein [Leptospira sp. 96542]|nr:lytic transglycosylase domain-containing protein [Leptospira sp. 96542]
MKANLNRMKKLSALAILVMVFLGESYGKLSPSAGTSLIRPGAEKAEHFLAKKRPKMALSERAVLTKLIEREAKNLKLPNGKGWDRLGFLLGVIQTESEFNPKAKSHKGALGLMQVMPATAKWLANKEGIPYKTAKDLYNPETNLRLGVLYLNYLFERTDSVEAALLAYNAGLGGYKRFGGIASYPKSIFKNYDEWKSFSYERQNPVQSVAFQLDI